MGTHNHLKSGRFPLPAAAGSGCWDGISFLRVDWWPFGQDFNVSFPSPLELSVEDERGLDLEAQRGVILKIDGDGVMSAGGEEFDFLGGFAANQWEFHETSVRKISFVENKLTRRGGSFRVFSCGFTWVDGAFSFCNSHALLTSGKRCVVRAMSVVQHWHVPVFIIQDYFMLTAKHVKNKF